MVCVLRGVQNQDDDSSLRQAFHNANSEATGLQVNLCGACGSVGINFSSLVMAYRVQWKVSVV